MRIVGRLAFALLVFAVWSDRATASGCLTRPATYRLANDTVDWKFSLGAGLECIQGLRPAAVLIDQVSVVSAPKGGSVAISGPSFRYAASPNFHGTDTFILSITGTRQRVNGTSSIQVDVTVP